MTSSARELRLTVDCKHLRRASASASEASILERARQFDGQALAAIHDCYFDDVYKYTLYRTNDPMVAEDLTSEVFTRFLEALLDPKRPPQQVRHWLMGVASHVVADYYRRVYRHEPDKLDPELPLRDPNECDPCERLEIDQRRRALHRALGQLNEEQQEVLSLRFGASFSLKETAEVMDKTVGAVKVLQYRALKNLRMWLESWE